MWEDYKIHISDYVIREILVELSKEEQANLAAAIYRARCVYMPPEYAYYIIRIIGSVREGVLVSNQLLFLVSPDLRRWNYDRKKKQENETRVPVSQEIFVNLIIKNTEVHT